MVKKKTGEGDDVTFLVSYSHAYLQSTIEIKSNGRKVCSSALPCPCDLITLITRELE